MVNSRKVVAIKVHFELNTPDKLRRVIFGLEKDNRDDKIVWIINFQLFEREKRTDPFDDPLVKLDIEVDSTLNSRAEKTALGDMTQGQRDHALGPAADDVKAALAGEIDQSEANRTIQNTLRKK